jgi:hypothetical protein
MMRYLVIIEKVSPATYQSVLDIHKQALRDADIKVLRISSRNIRADFVLENINHMLIHDIGGTLGAEAQTSKRPAPKRVLTGLIVDSRTLARV